MIDENEFFRQATLRISGSLNVETAMRRCMDYLKKWIPVSGIFFAIYDPDLHIGGVLTSVWPDPIPGPERPISHAY